MAFSKYEFPESELVIGLIAPLGVDQERIVDHLKDHFAAFGYTPNPIRLSGFLRALKSKGFVTTSLAKSPEARRIGSHMTAGNQARGRSGRGDVLALAAISYIHGQRSGHDRAEPLPRTAHILQSLKHPEEVRTLRYQYGSGFFLIGLFSPENERLKFLVDRKHMSERQARRLLERDRDEDDPYGQKTRKTFQLADAFVREPENVNRIVDLLFGCPFETPSRDEHAMYLAFAAALRSSDLSRQVGAVICDSQSNVLSVGCNDVPAFGGGLYWNDGDESDRDVKRGYDSNARVKREIAKDVAKILEPHLTLAPRDAARLLNDSSKLAEITEYGRAVHAEMEALLSCARTRVSPEGGTLYCTTFPCHNCAKHIIAAGIQRVVYVEPYPKSYAKRLHADAIALGADEESVDWEKVAFEPFVGIGPRRYFDLFSMNRSSGYPVVRKDGETKAKWKRSGASLRVPLRTADYLDRELVAAQELAVLKPSE